MRLFRLIVRLYLTNLFLPLYGQVGVASIYCIVCSHKQVRL